MYLDEWMKWFLGASVALVLGIVVYIVEKCTASPEDRKSINSGVVFILFIVWFVIMASQ